MVISIGELQALLINRDFNPYIDIDKPDKVLLHLIEELGELIKAYRKNGIMSNIFNDELGDCQILLCFFASSTYTDLEYCTLKKLRDNINTKRFLPSEKKLKELEPLFRGLK